MTILKIIICIMAGCGWKPVFYASRSLPANYEILICKKGKIAQSQKNFGPRNLLPVR